MGRGPLPLPHSEGHFMESIKINTIDEVVNAPAEAQVAQKEKVHIDRVTLGRDESDKVTSWLTQIKSSTKGFLDLTRSDVVNFLIQSHVNDLTTKEIKKIRLSHYSLIKHLNWITPQLKKAIEENNAELVKLLQSELMGLELGVIRSATEGSTGDHELKSRKPRQKKNRKTLSSEESSVKRTDVNPEEILSPNK